MNHQELEEYHSINHKQRKQGATKLLNEYLLMVTFDCENYSIRFKMKKHYSHSTKQELNISHRLILSKSQLCFIASSITYLMTDRSIVWKLVRIIFFWQ